jgi:hypothetical protein
MNDIIYASLDEEPIHKPFNVLEMRRQGHNQVGNLLGDNKPRQVTDKGSFKLGSYQEIQYGEQLTKFDIEFVQESDLPKDKFLNETDSLLQDQKNQHLYKMISTWTN